MPGGDRALYVYAVAEPPLPGRIRVAGRTLRALTIGRVAVIAGPPPPQDGVSTEDVQHQHAVVVALAARCPALLPARFGSLTTGRALQALLLERQAELVEALGFVKDRSQMTVRVFGSPDRARPVASRSSGTAFLESARARAHHLPPDVQAVRDVVGRWVAAERVEPGERGLRVTVFHLVARQDVDAYQQAASALTARLEPHRVAVTGPWPPFAFAPELF
jgi:hypothetical protein